MITLAPSKPTGEITVPASKSQTIRALLIACFSREKSIIRHPLLSHDTEACLKAVRQIGAECHVAEDGSEIRVDATGIVLPESLTIDAQNSGTTEYLLVPMAASLGIPVTITGDEQLRSRPVGPLAAALRDLGCEAEATDGKPPLYLKGPIKGGKTVIECRTSQYLSGLLLGSALGEGDTEIECSLLYEKPYVSLTLGWLRRQGIDFTITDDYMVSRVKGGQRYHGFDEFINGDWSSASFFLCMAAMGGGPVTVRGLDRDDPQGDKAILDVLSAMGAEHSWDGNAVTVWRNGPLKPGVFDLNAIPDTLPALAVTAACIDGTTVLGNVPQARIKETDRISCMRAELMRLGVDCEETEDSLIIHGAGKVSGGEVKGYGDHRIIMALASLSAFADSPITIDEEKAAAITFPSFFNLFDSIRSER